MQLNLTHQVLQDKEVWSSALPPHLSLPFAASVVSLTSFRRHKVARDTPCPEWLLCCQNQAPSGGGGSDSRVKSLLLCCLFSVVPSSVQKGLLKNGVPCECAKLRGRAFEVSMLLACQNMCCGFCCKGILFQPICLLVHFPTFGDDKKCRGTEPAFFSSPFLPNLFSYAKNNNFFIPPPLV